ncbi:MAG TPA: hypothetical protein VHA74_03020 [Candidatus Dojkabacteria bacterium]|nr:hypothetical protein [Candidatus Dojkabacteria bacterium]
MQNIKNLFKIAIITPLLFLILSINTNNVHAAINSETIKTYNLTAGDFKIEDFNYQNNTKSTQIIKVSTYTYDLKNGATTTDTPMVTASQPNITLKAGEDTTIKYLISIPETQKIGTYYNVLVVNVLAKSTSKINTENTFIQESMAQEMAITFMLNIENSESTYIKSFVKDSDTQLIVENPGFPYISPMTIKYTYTNKSPFVFAPNGKVEVFESGALLPANTFDVNVEKKNVYPNENISQTFTVDIWNNLSNIITSKKVSIKTYNGSTDTYFTNEIDVSILPQLIAVAVFGVSIIVLLIVLIVSLIKGAINLFKGKKDMKEAITEKQS